MLDIDSKKEKKKYYHIDLFFLGQFLIYLFLSFNFNIHGFHSLETSGDKMRVRMWHNIFVTILNLMLM